jgi:hypothetical protein
VQARRRVFLPLSSHPIDTTSRLPAPDLFNLNKTQQVPTDTAILRIEPKSRVGILELVQSCTAQRHERSANWRSTSKLKGQHFRKRSLSSPILFTSSFNFQMRTTPLHHLEPLVIMDAPNSASALNVLSIHGKPRLQSDCLRLTFP